MQSKDVSKLIFSLLVLAIGVKVITIIAKGYIQQPVVGISTELVGSLDSVGNLFIMGIGVIILILLPFYFSKKSEEIK